MSLRIQRSDVTALRVPHYKDFADSAGMPPYKIVIPSYDRPMKLCTTTLPLLKRHGIPLDKVAVFVQPGAAPGTNVPEWQRYLDAFRSTGFLDVRLREGAVVLASHVAAALRWVGEGYFITMSDSVSDLLECSGASASSGLSLRSTSNGTLSALIHHGYKLMVAGQFTAWSVNPAKSALRLRSASLSCRLGLLDGNLTGCILPLDWEKISAPSDMGLIYDVAWTVKLWAAGHRICRYSGVCVKHQYRGKGGQASVYKDPSSRRRQENQSIRALAREHPTLVQFAATKTSSLKVMNYAFSSTGEPPIVLDAPACVAVGRRSETFIDRPMTINERKRKERGALYAGRARGGQTRNQNARKRPASASNLR